MAVSMLALVTEKKDSEKWQPVLGPKMESEEDKTRSLGQLSDIDVKPFYRGGLDDEQSLIALVRYRKMVVFRLATILKRFALRNLVEEAKKRAEVLRGSSEKGKTDIVEDSAQGTTEKGKINFV